MFTLRTRCALVIAILLAPAVLSATDLSEQTLRSWDEYIRLANSRMQERLAGNAPYLWMTRFPAGASESTREKSWWNRLAQTFRKSAAGTHPRLDRCFLHSEYDN